MLELPDLRAALLFLEDSISLKNYVMSVVHEKSVNLVYHDVESPFFPSCTSGSSLAWDRVAAYAEKKGLALQLKKIEMLLL
jgi:hypothetical protein